MPFAIPYVAAAIEAVGISEAAATVIATVFVYAATAELTALANQALNPQPKTGIGAGLESNYYNSEASIRIIYGTVKVGGIQTIPPITYQANQ